MDETALQQKIRKGLVKQGAYVFKVHGGRFSQGVPDLVGCYRGYFFGFEVKLPGKEKTLTKLQLENLERIQDADGLGAMVTSLTQALKLLVQFEEPT